jgi:hypothetical protein
MLLSIDQRKRYKGARKAEGGGKGKKELERQKNEQEKE